MDFKRSTIILIFSFFISQTLSIYASDDKPDTKDPEKSVEPVVSIITADYTDYSKITNHVWSDLEVDETFYDDPFQISLFNEQHGENPERLWSQTKTIFFLGLGVAGAISLLPEEISGWHPSDEKAIDQWKHNLSEGPYWDRDRPYINYIGHPYSGGIYYQIARKSGYRQWDSFLYAAMMSTFYWEFGVEAFAEVPSVQDLVVTPVGGWLVGEWLFQQEKDIRLHGGTALGSEFWGDIALFFLDPVDSIGRGINNLFDKQIIQAGTGYVSLHQNYLPGGQKENLVKLNFNYEYGANTRYVSSFETANKNSREDPINTSIVGVSTGLGYGSFDSDWEIENKAFVAASFGLYFTPEFSATLSYLTTHLNPIGSDEEFTWENYNISGQYYFNTDQNLRPYVVAGIGEMLKDEDNNTKTFQTHAGAGLYYKISPKWAWQTDLRLWYSSRHGTIEKTINSQLIYRFGKGETSNKY